MPVLGNKKGKNFLVIMIIIAMLSLLLRIAIVQLIKRNISQNESAAQATLKLISTALENYAKNNQGFFPASLSTLIKSQPSYLDRDYIKDSPVKGYDYTCSKLETSGYSCAALPSKCMLTGEAVYTVSTGSLFVMEKCGRKEKE